MPQIQQDESGIPKAMPPELGQPGSGDASTAPSARVDMEALAQRVYALLKREVTIERERGGSRTPLL